MQTMSCSSTLDPRSNSGLRDIHRLINECREVLQADPSCLHTRAVRGHACMKAKLWDQAVHDFSEILRCRPDDVHGRFSRGMALFKSGRVDDAHSDFSRVLELNPNHVMARYARAGCYNSEGEINQAIQEYMLALQHDEKENARGFRSEKRRIGMHECAEHLIRKTMGGSTRSRRANSEPPLDIASDNDRKSSRSVSEVAINHPTMPEQQSSAQPTQDARSSSASAPAKRPRKVVQVRVNLSDFSAAPQSSTQLKPAPPQKLQKEVEPATTSHLDAPKICCANNQIQTETSRDVAVRALPKTVRKVTVAL
ncbi:Tetratricopeptide repeat [Phytophthora infestans]|uniref:Tetratricopeptide repeat n=1 Tax=Phytophthora infestans TaxID=4787 RepID=A0A8S9TNA7_PHYIN|nr:Tetratricopeptide repeat [Phytophthora infestans]